MRVFVYGSLMLEPWEQDFGGRRRGPATLLRYRRAFNKRSTRNWGTQQAPCPTLGLESVDGARCIGLLFEFPDEQRDRILDYLRDREGQGFDFPELDVETVEGSLRAIVPVNDRSHRTYIGRRTQDERARLAREAAGEKGSCREYVERVRASLQEMGVVDQDVEEFWRVVRDP